jgi:PAS domain-containing protein
MKTQPNWVEKRQTLRTQAETMLSSLAPAETPLRPVEAMVHELLVHKVELEMQIEELRRTHTAMEEARDSYVDLYDFGSVGYITLSALGLIHEINKTASALLGDERDTLVHARFSKLVATIDEARWLRVFRDAMEAGGIHQESIVLQMTRGDGSSFNAHIDCRRRESVEGPPILLLAVFDIARLTEAETAASVAEKSLSTY